jgi:hypothetical protein
MRSQRAEVRNEESGRRTRNEGKTSNEELRRRNPSQESGAKKE